MKIRLLIPQRLMVPAGTEIDVDEGRAALLMEIGAAVEAEKPKKKAKKEEI